jgi:hypothetical protein
MNAEEMFEKLGYKKLGYVMTTSKSEFFCLEYMTKPATGDRVSQTTIGFNNQYKTYDVVTHYAYKGRAHYCNMPISIDLHRAITQQLKELGWVE